MIPNRFQPPPSKTPIVTTAFMVTVNWIKWFIDLVDFVSAVSKGVNASGVNAAQAVGAFLGGPASGGSALPTFRPLTLSDLPSTGLSVTITTAKLTGGGSNGSMTFQNGLLVASTPAT